MQQAPLLPYSDEDLMRFCALTQRVTIIAAEAAKGKPGAPGAYQHACDQRQAAGEQLFVQLEQHQEHLNAIARSIGYPCIVDAHSAECDLNMVMLTYGLPRAQAWAKQHNVRCYQSASGVLRVTK